MLQPGAGAGEGAGTLGEVTEVLMARLQLEVEEILMGGVQGGKWGNRC